MNDEIKELTCVKMLVWDDDESKAEEREVYGKVSGHHYPIRTSGGTAFYKHAKPLPKPWEVAPEGYRLVTDEEKERFKKPKEVVLYGGIGMGWVIYKSDGTLPLYPEDSYAVPLDFTFELEVKRMTMTEVCALAGCNVEIVEG